jgi:hypothetical protein
MSIGPGGGEAWAKPDGTAPGPTGPERKETTPSPGHRCGVGCLCLRRVRSRGLQANREAERKARVSLPFITTGRTWA